MRASYAKNQNLGFWIPYTLNGEERNYQPDFIVQLRAGADGREPRNLIVKVSGKPTKDKPAKVAMARDL